MIKEKPVVVITRTQPDADALASRLEGLGYAPLLEPMLKVRATHAVSSHDPLCVEGLVVTSAQALRHLNTLVREVALRHKALYAVGPRTASMAREMGWTNVHDGGGDVRTLGAFLSTRKEISPSSRLLHICGRDIAHDTRDILNTVPCKIWDWVVYETESADGFSPPFTQALQAGEIRAILFHSARAASTFAQNVQTYAKEDDLSGITFLCLSGAVLKSLSAIQTGHVYAANTPDEDALLALLKAHMPVYTTEPRL